MSTIENDCEDQGFTRIEYGDAGPATQGDFDTLVDTYAAELMAMPDEAVLGGIDATTAKAVGLKVLEVAKAEAAKRRKATEERGKQ